MEGIVRRKTGSVVKALEEWFEPFKIPEDPNKPFLQRYREHVESLREQRKTPEFKLRSVRFTTVSIKCVARIPIDQSFLTCSQATNFRFSKLKDSADHIFIFDENGIKFSKLVENTMG